MIQETLALLHLRKAVLFCKAEVDGRRTAELLRRAHLLRIYAKFPTSQSERAIIFSENIGTHSKLSVTVYSKTMPGPARGAPKRLYWYLVCLVGFAFFMSIQSRAPLQNYFSRAFRREDALLTDRRCQGSAWPQAVAATLGNVRQLQTAADTAQKPICPQKVIFGDQRAWMSYVSSEFGFLFEALRLRFGWAYVTWIEAHSWDEIMHRYRLDFPDCAAPKLIMFVEQYGVLSQLNSSGLQGSRSSRM